MEGAYDRALLPSIPLRPLTHENEMPLKKTDRKKGSGLMAMERCPPQSGGGTAGVGLLCFSNESEREKGIWIQYEI
jgi:hypothetical protein